MEKKAKISVEIPGYLKSWIEGHDISQNALVTMGLRRLFLEEKIPDTDKIITAMQKFLNDKRLPF